MYSNLPAQTICFELLSMARRQRLDYLKQDLIDYVQMPLYDDALTIGMQKINYTCCFLRLSFR